MKSKPTCHMNGTSPNDLREMFLNVRSKLVSARKALEEATPNGRDYYPQPNDPDTGRTAIQVAVDEWRDRAKMLEQIEDEMLELAQHVDQFCKD